jgi:type I restriction enzyme S subunit
MSKIDELIAEFCPEGVPRFSIGELCKVETGKRDANEGSDDGQYHFFTTAMKTGRIDTFRWDCDALLIAGNANVGNVKHFNGKFDAYQRTYVLTGFRQDVDVRYLYFALSNTLNFYLDANKNVAAMTYIVLKTLANFEVSVPPLEVQREIVSILYKFTQLEAELEAELEARKSQFEYYRQNVLTFDVSEVPNSFLGDIYDFQYGKGNTIPTKGGKYPVYGSNGVVGSHNEFNSEDAPVIGHIGAYAGIVNWADGEHFVTYNGVICKIKAGFDPRFGYHLLMKQNLRELANEGSQPFVSYNKLKSVVVQLPTINKQKELAVLLDSLEAITSDVSIGLPAEIAARRKQYEYYRNKLLTFKELEAA